MANKHEGEQNRIMKNTVMLYIRMAVIMLVTLYISRVILNELGETDFGIYNIVGSVVVSLVFIQNTLVSATQRFLSYEIGRGAEGNVSRIFSMAINIHILFIVVILLLLETVGLWFLNSVLNIPEDRMFAANIAYQFSIATFVVNILRTPYNALIISKEKMDAYAVISIVEAILKLAIAYILLIASHDKLVVYAALVFVVTSMISLAYYFYCKLLISESCRYRFIKDSSLFKKMMDFSGWNLLSGVTGIAVAEGPNYFMNVYIGVHINAAMGIAKQVSSAVYQFTANFQTAFNPQIVKTYAAGERDGLYQLVYNTSKISFFLVFIVAFPLIICADTILELWLVYVPEYAVQFCILLMIAQCVSALSSPLWMVAHAVGDLKRYQISQTFICLLIIPATCFILSNGYNVCWILVSQIFTNVLIFHYRSHFLKGKVNFPITQFYKEILRYCVIPIVLVIPLPVIASKIVAGIFQKALLFAFTLILTAIVFYFMGLKQSEKNTIKHFAANKFLRRR